MGSIPSDSKPKPHAVCMPYPAQGHITPMLTVAKLLHSSGFHITFVNTEYNHRRLLRSLGPTSLNGLPDFQFTVIPDGLPFSDEDVTQDVPSLCESIMTNKGLPYFRDLLCRLNESDPVTPKVTCVFADFTMCFAMDAAKEIGIPCALLWTASACGLLGYLHYRTLMEKGLIPLKDMDQLNNGYLDTPVNFVPGFSNMRLKDFPSFIRTTDPNDIMIKYVLYIMDRASAASAVAINTFREFERPVLDQIATMLPPIYEIGPVSMLSHQIKESSLKSLGSNLWKLQPGCLDWLEGKKAGSIVYVNFGSVTVMTNQQLIEFAWGLANTGYEFLWIIRPDLVRGDTAVLPEEFLEEIKERGMLASWCPQEAVLKHPAIGAFLTHSGWNSTLETISGGVPVVSWPFFAEQQTNCRFVCTEWGIGMEIDNNVKRTEVEVLIREIMGGEKGKKMKERALKWKESAAVATQNGGSSFVNFQKLVNEVLLSNNSG
ncbi:7-deoxyloganetin glucosyltransferase-like protein [Carex littledalei]|uniref:Glycosyltransferase n=1 Tax=Carex littledalei TaxID=544730 RepID=A0A833VHA4_9POAL|nr:7-deoxyloganetin glucosyltransferase-like protein [Carex littledalei]